MRIAYLCLQPRQLGSASSAHVDELVRALDVLGASVKVFEVDPEVPSTLRSRSLAASYVQLRLIRHLRHFDAVYVRMHPFALPTVIAARVLRLPVGVEVNGVATDYIVMWPVVARLRGLIECALVAQLWAATAVFAVTDGIAAWVRAAARPKSMMVLPNAVDVDKFCPDLPRPEDVPANYALYFGSLVKWQGLEMSLDAAAHPDWPEDVSLVVIGDGPLRDRVEQAARDLPGRVIYLGVRPHNEVPAYVAGAAVSLTLKDYHDPKVGQSALKVYESLACGTPVVAAALHGTTDVAALARGLLVLPEVTAAAAAAAVRDLNHCPERRKDMGRAGRAGAATRTWSDNAQSVLDALSDERVGDPGDANRVFRSK
jgi:glycosyltransferase involved in cell wall biosynthesis